MKKTNPANLASSHSPSRRSDSDSLNGRLAAYSTAGKAALVAGAAMGATAVAQGQIINLTAGSFTGYAPATISSPLGLTTPATSVVGNANFNAQLQLGAQALTLRAVQTNASGSSIRTAKGYAKFQGTGGNGFRIAGAGSLAKNFVGAAPLLGAFTNPIAGAKLLKTSGYGPATGNFNVGNKTAGQFNFGSPGYVGFRLQKSVGNFYYGWLKVSVTADSNGRPQTISFVADGNGVYGAYNSTLNGAIAAGQVAAIPEPANVAAGLALFALGAVGVREHRRRRKLAA